MASDLPRCFSTKKLTKEEHEAFKALSKGEATEYQQRLTTSIIVKNFSATHDQAYMSGSSEDTAFMLGRGFVGKQILKYINTTVKGDEDEK